MLNESICVPSKLIHIFRSCTPAILFFSTQVLFCRNAEPVTWKIRKKKYYGIIKCLLFSQVKDMGKQSYNIKRKIIRLDNGIVFKLKTLVVQKKIKKKNNKNQELLGKYNCKAKWIIFRKRTKICYRDIFIKYILANHKSFQSNIKRKKQKSSTNNFKKLWKDYDRYRDRGRYEVR